MSNFEPKSQLYQYKEAYVLTDYPQAVEYADAQNHVFWTHGEIDVSKDIQDMRVHMTPAEYHGIITTLKLFVKYEVHVGVDHWIKNIMMRYPRPEIQRMANCFSFVETNIHAPFYSKLNEALMLDTEDFYMSYLQDPELAARANFIGKYTSSKNKEQSVVNDLISLGVFSLIEGAVLYSSFAFLKHFQAEGKNKMLNVVRGINFSVRDENLHAEAGAWLFRTLLTEALECGDITQEERLHVLAHVHSAARMIEEHEGRIIDMIYEKGKIPGLKQVDLKTFVKSRVDLCLSNLQMEPIYKVQENPIADWFYKNINSVQFNDFFSGLGSNYNRNWNETGFTWKTKEERE